MLQCHTVFVGQRSHSTLRTPHFISFHLIWNLFTPPHHFSSLLICHLSSSQLFSCQLTIAQPFIFISWKPFLTHLSSSVLQNAFIASTSHYFFVLWSLHKELPSTTLLYKTCTKNCTALLCNTKLAESTSEHYFALKSLRKVFSTEKLLHREAFRHRSLYTEKLLHSEVFTQRHFGSLPAPQPVIRFLFGNIGKRPFSQILTRSLLEQASRFVTPNVEVSRFANQNIEASRFASLNVEVSRFANPKVDVSRFRNPNFEVWKFESLNIGVWRFENPNVEAF